MVEAVTGKKLVDYFRENIFIPAGMDTIGEDSVYALIPHRTRGYQLRPNGVVENCDLSDTSNKIAGGGLISTSTDLVKFALALSEGKLVKKDTLARMWTSEKLPDGKLTEYGLGFDVRRPDGLLVVGHTGGQRGSQTNLVILPERGITLSYMMNLESSTALIPIARGLRAILLEP